MLEVLRSLDLKLLRLTGNPLVATIKGYRKTILATFPNLNYLDESPCFEQASLAVGGPVDCRRDAWRVAWAPLPGPVTTARPRPSGPALCRCVARGRPRG